MRYSSVLAQPSDDSTATISLCHTLIQPHSHSAKLSLCRTLTLPDSFYHTFILPHFYSAKTVLCNFAHSFVMFASSGEALWGNRTKAYGQVENFLEIFIKIYRTHASILSQPYSL
jgi:hypothetical protein